MGNLMSGSMPTSDASPDYQIEIGNDWGELRFSGDAEEMYDVIQRSPSNLSVSEDYVVAQEYLRI